VAKAMKVPVGASICARPVCRLRKLRCERIVAAGVEDHDVERVLRRVHHRQHQVDVDRAELDLVFARDVGVHRDEVVAAPGLDAVSGVVEQAHTPFRDLVAEGADRALHSCLRRVLHQDDFEAGAAERLAIARASFTGLRSGPFA
jgi:hypothetical protein